MSQAAALVADASPAMSQLLCNTLRSAGYRVNQAGNAVEVAERVHQMDLLTDPKALLVVGVGFASQSAVPISVAASQRWGLRLPPFKVIALFEWGTLGTTLVPHLHHCEIIAVLEKPFQLSDLEEIAKFALVEVA